MPQPVIKNLLLTGPPGCGKTTVILRLVELLRDLRLAGFYTQELRERGRRVGFEAVGLSSGRCAVLARVQSRSRQRVGRYGVEPQALAPLVESELKKSEGEVDAFLIDEVGKMELLCPAFVEAAPRLFDGAASVIATVALRGEGLIARVKARPDVRLLQVTPDNRDDLPGQLERWLREAVQVP